MHPLRKRRLILIIMMLLGIGLAAFLILRALEENVLFFFSPTEVKAGKAPIGQPFRAGGLVVKGSVIYGGGLGVAFVVTDHKENLSVFYDGILPDLFREGQGIIALGTLDEKGRMMATQVLAKHDENYMPPEVHEALKAGKEE